MKKLLLAFAALTLVGAGCSSAATTSTSTDTQASGPNTATPIIGGTETVDTQGGDQAMDGMDMTGTSDANAAADVEVNTPPVSGGATATATLKVSLEAGNFFFAPKTITAKAGQNVEVTITKVDGFHNFSIDGVTSAAISTGTVVKFTAPTKAGSYPYYCNIGSHRSLGMEGTLIVQ